MLTSSWIARFYSLGVPLLAVPDLDARRSMESLYMYSVFKITFRTSSKHPIEKRSGPCSFGACATRSLGLVLVRRQSLMKARQNKSPSALRPARHLSRRRIKRAGLRPPLSIPTPSYSALRALWLPGVISTQDPRPRPLFVHKKTFQFAGVRMKGGWRCCKGPPFDF